MDHSMDLTKEHEEYKLGIKRQQKKQPKQEEVVVTCHLYLPHRTSLFLGTSSGALLMWRPKNEFHAEIVRTDLAGHRGPIFDILELGGSSHGSSGTGGIGEDESALSSSGGGWGHGASAASLGHLIATCSADRTVKIWDVFERELKQRCIQTLIGHEGSVTSMTFLRGSLVTCSTDNSVKIWRSSPERSLLLYPFFEVVQEIWGPGGKAPVPSSLASILGQPPPLTTQTTTAATSTMPTANTVGTTEKSVLKACPFVVGRLVRAEQQLLFVGDQQGRVYTFVPPARSGFAAAAANATSLKYPQRSSGGETSDGFGSGVTSGMNTGLNTPHIQNSRPPSGAFSHLSSFPPSSTGSFSVNPIPPSSVPLGSGQPMSSSFDFSKSHKIHALSVSKMLIVHQESLIITLSFDHTVQVHDCLSGNGYFGIENPTRCRYLSMDWDLNNQELFLSDEGGYIQVWNIYIEKCLKSIKLKNEPILSVSLHAPNKLLLGVADGIEVWSIQRNVKFNEFKGHDGPIIQLLQISSSSLSNLNIGRMKFEGSGGQAKLTRNPSGGRKNHHALPTEEEVKTLTSMVNEEKYLYSASLDFTIRQWDSYDMNCLSIIKERQSEIACMAYIPGSIILATGHDDGVIRLWNIDSGTYMNLLHHRNTISCLCVAKTHRQDCLISGSFDKTIAVWDITRQRSFNPIPEFSLTVSDEEVLCCAYHSQLGLIFTGGNDTLIHMWNLETRAKEGVFKGHKNAVGCLALDGNFLISGSDDTTVIVWNIHLQYQVAVLTGHELSIRDLLVVPSYGFIVSTSFDGRVIVWNYLKACALKQFHHFNKRFRCLLYDSTQHKIFAGTEESKIMFFILPEELFREQDEMRRGKLKAIGAASGEQVDGSEGAKVEEKKEEFPLPASSSTKSLHASPNTIPISNKSPIASSSTLVPLASSPNQQAVAQTPSLSVQPSVASLTSSSSTSHLPRPNSPTEVFVDYSSIVAELTAQSLQIQTLLSTVKSPPAARSSLVSSASASSSSSTTTSSVGAGAGGSAVNALKRAPVITAPAQARRASLTPANQAAMMAAMAAAAQAKSQELSPPTAGQTLALRRASINLAQQQKEKEKDLTMRPRQPVPSTSSSQPPTASRGASPQPQVPSTAAVVSPPSATTSSARATLTVPTEASRRSSFSPTSATLTIPSESTRRSSLSPTPSPSASTNSSLSPATTPASSSSPSVHSLARRASLTSGNLRDIQSLLKPSPELAAAIEEKTDSSVTSAIPVVTASTSPPTSPALSSSVASVGRRASMLGATLRDIQSSGLLKAQPAEAHQTLDHSIPLIGEQPPSPAAASASFVEPPLTIAPPGTMSRRGSLQPEMAIQLQVDGTGTIVAAASSSSTSRPTTSNAARTIVAGDSTAPTNELTVTNRIQRFSMPSAKGRLEFNV